MAALAMAARLEWQPFNIPSGAMSPTLEVGDYIFVRHYRFIEPKRGDVAVFLHRGDQYYYTKRLIGFPGDTIQLRDGVLYVNRTAMKREHMGSDRDPDRGARERYRETLLNGIAYSILLASKPGPATAKACDKVVVKSGGDAENICPFIVPPGCFFMIGDNRDNSFDSRFADFGVVARDDLVGRADIIWWSRSPERIGKLVE